MYQRIKTQLVALVEKIPLFAHESCSSDFSKSFLKPLAKQRCSFTVNLVVWSPKSNKQALIIINTLFRTILLVWTKKTSY